MLWIRELLGRANRRLEVRGRRRGEAFRPVSPQRLNGWIVVGAVMRPAVRVRNATPVRAKWSREHATAEGCLLGETDALDKTLGRPGSDR